MGYRQNKWLASIIKLMQGALLTVSLLGYADWPLHGHDTFEQLQSPLTQINLETVKNLGLVWSMETGTRLGLEASPIVIDGIMYTTGSWSKVFAVDAASGRLRWQFDP